MQTKIIIPPSLPTSLWLALDKLNWAITDAATEPCGSAAQAIELITAAGQYINDGSLHTALDCLDTAENKLRLAGYIVEG